MKESSLALPTLKRVCLREAPDFAPLPGLITGRMILLSMTISVCFGLSVKSCDSHVTVMCSPHVAERGGYISHHHLHGIRITFSKYLQVGVFWDFPP